MQSEATTTEQYLNELPEDRKEPVKLLRQQILDNLPKGVEERMSYGMLGYVIPHSVYPDGYHCKPEEPLPLMSFASQKNSVNLYHSGIYAVPEIHDWFVAEYPKHCKTKLDMGKSCIRFKKVANIPYDLITPLFTDYAKKKRFIWLPNGVSGSYVDDYSPIDLPEGTILIKNFFYNNVQPNNSTKIIETRIMYKKSTEWDFANYVWNEEQTEAFFTNQGSILNISWVQGESIKTTNYRVPSRAECFTCHKIQENAVLIGPKPRNLNRTYAYGDGIQNQIPGMSLCLKPGVNCMFVPFDSV